MPGIIIGWIINETVPSITFFRQWFTKVFINVTQHQTGIICSLSNIYRMQYYDILIKLHYDQLSDLSLKTSNWGIMGTEKILTNTHFLLNFTGWMIITSFIVKSHAIFFRLRIFQRLTGSLPAESQFKKYPLILNKC